MSMQNQVGLWLGAKCESDWTFLGGGGRVMWKITLGQGQLENLHKYHNEKRAGSAEFVVRGCVECESDKPFRELGLAWKAH